MKRAWTFRVRYAAVIYAQSWWVMDERMIGIDWDEVAELLKEGLVKRTKHPEKDLWIYNYSQTAQFSGALKTNHTLRQMRGVIVDPDHNIIARGFPKFFNLGEQPDVDAAYKHLPFRVEEKVDGSLGILYHDGEDWAIATRGSFTSEQAVEAAKILREKYSAWTSQLEPVDGVTLLFEIVYPENRIVVNYADKRDLIYLGSVVKETGKDAGVSYGWYGPMRAIYANRSYEEPGKGILGHIPDGLEGFVLVYDNGHKVKIKFDEYLRLHRIVTGCNEHSVWEACAEDKLASLLNNVPDEFCTWARGVINKFQKEHAWRLSTAENAFALAKVGADGDRKVFSELVKATPWASACFGLLDGRRDRVVKQIWKMIEPRGVTPSPFGKRAEA